MSKKLRHQTILDLVGSGGVTSQEHLRAKLEALGYAVTQSTLSRDLKELDLVKTARGYELPVAKENTAQIAHRRLEQAVLLYLLRCDRAQNFVVLRTEAGHAHPLAAAIDQAGLDGVLGTIAGDDTVLVLARDESAAEAASGTVLKLASGPG